MDFRNDWMEYTMYRIQGFGYQAATASSHLLIPLEKMCYQLKKWIILIFLNLALV